MKTLTFLKKKEKFASTQSGTVGTAGKTPSREEASTATTAQATETTNSQKQKRTRRKRIMDSILLGAGSVTKQDTHKFSADPEKNQGKPLTWRNKEMKSKFHNNKIVALVDLENLDEMKDRTNKIEEESKLMELPKNQFFL